MGEPTCRREALRRSVLITGAAAVGTMGLSGVANARSARTVRWEVSPLPGSGTLLGASVHELSSVLFAAVADDEVTRVHSVPVGGDSWQAVEVSSAGRADLAFCVASDGTLVVAGAKLRLVDSRCVSVYLDPQGRALPPVAVGGGGELVEIADYPEIVVEDWARTPAAVASTDGGRTWSDVDVGVASIPNAWFDQVVPLGGKAGATRCSGRATPNRDCGRGTHRSQRRPVPRTAQQCRRRQRCPAWRRVRGQPHQRRGRARRGRPRLSLGAPAPPHRWPLRGRRPACRRRCRLTGRAVGGR